MPLCQLRKIVGVQGLAEFQKHEVGGVHDRADRTKARAFEPFAQPLRHGSAIIHALDYATGKSRAAHAWA